MFPLTRVEPIDYLIIGHLSYDITPDGPRLGGTAAYAARTAFALGFKVGLVTSWGDEFPLEPYLGSLPIINIPTDASTKFENIQTDRGRIQNIHAQAALLDFQRIPESWRNAPIVHLAPIAQEIESSIIRHFPQALIGITPQGWLRQWDQHGHVALAEWPEAAFVLSNANVVIFSEEDLQYDDARIEEMVMACPVAIVTAGAQGGHIYWNGDVRRYAASSVDEVDSVGAGDIFATCFIARYHKTCDPWESARFASLLAGQSVTRCGLDSIPRPEEINSATIEVF